MERDGWISVDGSRWVSLSLLVVLVTMGGVGLVSLEETWKKILAGLLLAGLAALLVQGERKQPSGRWLHLFLAGLIALIIGLLSLGPQNNGFGFLLFIPAGQAAVFLPARWAIRWGVFSFLVMAVHSLLAWGNDGIINILFNAGGYFFVYAFGSAVRQAELARRESQELLQALQAAQQQLQALAVTEERNRLAREMHDSLGHRLTVAVVQLEGAQRLISSDPGRAERMVQSMRAQLKEALADLRRTVAALREEDLPLEKALARLARGFGEDTGMRVHLNLPAVLPRLPDAYRLALYRAAQEALTNAQRHAGGSQVWLDLTLDGSSILLAARDDGRGSEKAQSAGSGGFGLRGLRERAEGLGGEFQFTLQDGQGAQLRMRLPLPGEAV